MENMGSADAVCIHTGCCFFGGSLAAPAAALFCRSAACLLVSAALGRFLSLLWDYPFYGFFASWRSHCLCPISYSTGGGRPDRITVVLGRGMSFIWKAFESGTQIAARVGDAVIHINALFYPAYDLVENPNVRVS